MHRHILVTSLRIYIVHHWNSATFVYASTTLLLTFNWSIKWLSHSNHNISTKYLQHILAMVTVRVTNNSIQVSQNYNFDVMCRAIAQFTKVISHFEYPLKISFSLWFGSCLTLRLCKYIEETILNWMCYCFLKNTKVCH